MNGKHEFGDYQTPLDFADRICRYLKYERNIMPSAVIEPTCGLGNFIKSSLLFDAGEYYGIEINPEYCEICNNTIKDERVKIYNSDFFTFSFNSIIKDKSRVLIIGNPPWVTNSALSVMGSDNLPIKANFKGLKGMDAIMGLSNFDICEYIILRLINEYRNTNTVISMLCKTSVARNVFKELKRNDINFETCDILEFNAFKIFGVNTSACLFIVQLSMKNVAPDICNVYNFDDTIQLKTKFGFSNGYFYSNFKNQLSNFEGACCFEWRQGVKHDCSKVMELTVKDNAFQNGKNESVNIEKDIVFPLVKSSMFKTPIIHNFTKYVIVTQKKLREETKHLECDVPKTWKYLNKNIDSFERRKSSIYHGAPPFSMFGIGEYSYSQYKVGVSGFYKRPMFSVLYSNDNKPVMTDDTSYFICFDSFDMAYVAMIILNSLEVQKFLLSIAFLDAKRPYTKKVLNRIDFGKIVGVLSMDDLKKTEKSLKLKSYITDEIYAKFKSLTAIGQMSFL